MLSPTMQVQEPTATSWELVPGSRTDLLREMYWAKAHERARVRLGCADAQGKPAECDSTEAVLRGFDAANDEVGLRGALRRLFERIVGSES